VHVPVASLEALVRAASHLVGLLGEGLPGRRNRVLNLSARTSEFRIGCAFQAPKQIFNLDNELTHLLTDCGPSLPRRLACSYDVHAAVVPPRGNIACCAFHV
jgi:hypothetical protein